MDEPVKISIIITTYNDLDNLIRAIKSIELIHYPREQFEVIVVDDGSNDGTSDYLRALGVKVEISFHYIVQENRGPSSARNSGIRKSRGEFLLIIDSDCTVDKEILNRYLEHFPDDSLGGIGGDIVPDKTNWISGYLDSLGVWRPGGCGTEIKYLVTANAFFLKKAVTEVGCFDERFRFPGGEDPELCYRVRKKGYYFKYDEHAKVVHSHRTNIKSFMKMFYNHGRGYAVFASKWPEECPCKSVMDAVFGLSAIRLLLHNNIRKSKLGKALLTFSLDYLRFLSTYCGYRSMIKGLNVKDQY